MSNSEFSTFFLLIGAVAGVAFFTSFVAVLLDLRTRAKRKESCAFPRNILVAHGVCMSMTSFGYFLSLLGGKGYLCTAAADEQGIPVPSTLSSNALCGFQAIIVQFFGLAGVLYWAGMCHNLHISTRAMLPVTSRMHLSAYYLHTPWLASAVFCVALLAAGQFQLSLTGTACWLNGDTGGLVLWLAYYAPQGIVLSYASVVVFGFLRPVHNKMKVMRKEQERHVLQKQSKGKSKHKQSESESESKSKSKSKKHADVGRSPVQQYRNRRSNPTQMVSVYVVVLSLFAVVSLISSVHVSVALPKYKREVANVLQCRKDLFSRILEAPKLQDADLSCPVWRSIFNTALVFVGQLATVLSALVFPVLKVALRLDCKALLCCRCRCRCCCWHDSIPSPPIQRLSCKTGSKRIRSKFSQNKAEDSERSRRETELCSMSPKLKTSRLRRSRDQVSEKFKLKPEAVRLAVALDHEEAAHNSTALSSAELSNFE